MSTSPKPLFSLVMEINGKLESSGIIPDLQDGVPTSDDFGTQDQQVLFNIKKLLKDKGRNVTDLYRMRIWIQCDSKDDLNPQEDPRYMAFNELYMEFFQDMPADKMPLRSAVGPSAIPVGVMVEIEFRAH